MARRVNKNLVGLLTFLVMLSTTAAGIVMVAMLPEKDPTFYTDQAVKAVEAGQYARAAGLYRKAYSVSEDVHYLADAAAMLYENGNPASALQLLDLAVAADNTFLDGYLEALRIRLELARQASDNQSAKMITWWQKILEICKRIEGLDADNANMLQARGLARIHLQTESPENRDKGIEDLRRAVELEPKDPNKAYDLAVQYEVLLKDWEKADRIFQKLIETDDTNATSHRLYGRFLARRAAAGGPADQVQSSRKRAVTELEQAVQLDPNDASNYISIGRVFAGQESNPDKAEEYFRKAIAADESGYSSFLNLGVLYLEQGHPKKALEVFRDRLKRPPARHGYLAYLRRTNYFMLLRRALQIALQVAWKENDSGQRNAYVKEAQGYLQASLREIGENGLTHEMQGEIFIIQNRIRDAIHEFEEADKLSRGVSPKLKRRLASLYLQDHAPGPARSILLEVLKAETLAQGSASIPTLLTLARIENSLENPAQSVVYTDQILKRSPENKEAITIRMESYRRLGQLDRVAALSEQIDSNDLDSKIRKARIAVMQGQFEKAEKLFKEMIGQPPPKPNVVQLYANMLLRQGRRNEAEAVVEETAKLVPDDYRLAVLRIRLRKDITPEKREALLLEQYQGIKDALTRETQLAAHFAKKGKETFPKALEHYHQAEKILAEEKPTNPQKAEYVRQMLAKVLDDQFAIFVVLGDWNSASELVDRAGARNVDGAKGLFYRGRLSLAKNESNEAVEYIRSGLEIRPTSSEGLQYLGAAYLQGGKYDEARSAFEQALHINPNNGQAHLGLAQLYTLLNDSAKKETHFAECLRLLPSDPWVRKEVQLRAERKNPATGIARRERLRKQQPNNVRNLVRLATLYRLNGENQKGEDVLLAAIEFAPGNASVAAAAAEFYRTLDHDGAGKGEALLKKLAEEAADTASQSKAYLLLAQHYSNLGRSAEAEQAFSRAAELDQSPAVCLSIGQWSQKTGRWDEAVDWYRKCLARMEKPTKYVHRLLLDALVNSTKQEGALEEADHYRKNFPDDPVVIIYEGRLAMAQGRLEDAAKHFDLYLERDQTAALGFFLRGHLRHLRNQYESAIEDLKRAKAIDLRGFAYQHRIELSQTYGELGLIEEEIAELESILRNDPKAFHVAETLTDVYERTRRFTDLEAFALRYENLDSGNPTWPLARARALEALQRPKEELDALEKASRISNYDPKIVAQFASQLIRYELPDRLITLVEEKILESRRTPDLLRLLGHAYLMKDETEKGVAIYDRALEASITEHQLYTNVVADMSGGLGKDALMKLARRRVEENGEDRSAARLLAELLILEDTASSEVHAILIKLLKAESDEKKRLPILLRLGINANARKDIEQSIAYYKQVLTIDPDNALALNNLAYLLAESLKQPADALPYAVRAARAQNSASIFDTLGWTYYLLGDYGNSVAWLIRAKDLDPKMIVVSYHLALAYHKRGNHQAAVNEIRNASRLSTQQQDKDYSEKIAEAMREIGTTASTETR